MSRILKVIRLQLINRQMFIWVPLIILGSAMLVSIPIYAMIPISGPKFGGAAQAPLWYFFAIGMSALTLTFPFSQAMSVTRREFFLGTLVTAILGSFLMSLVFLVGGWIEELTGGWGLNGYVFRLPWLWEAGPFAAGLTYFTLAMLFFFIGFAGATIYKRGGATMTTVASLGVVLVLIGIAFLVTRLGLWPQVWEGIMTLGALGLTLWALGVVAVLATTSYLVLRRATP
ncbi:hypothetical protein J2Y69_001534 [Microbacterium resistens]|uniref:ABC transporter permease n=1 Tax=Microbacterium resistens TaxID=156977 RepID=A0ABU1SBD0_9MICO|nr:hypothetical protein [Microbacterium resistens]MDR6866935.1 hypothetical protein [Microbacterium resistens]